MALFWHNHFATGLQQDHRDLRRQRSDRMMAASRREDPGGVRGQLELFREYALGNFRDLLIAVAKDPAMLVWLDGRLNTNATSRRRTSRARSWSCSRSASRTSRKRTSRRRRACSPAGTCSAVGAGGRPDYRYEYFFDRDDQHDSNAKDFTFPIYPGRRPHHRRQRRAGRHRLHQRDRRHPETGPRLARKLYAFFVSETQPAPQPFVDRVSRRLLRRAATTCAPWCAPS